ncbi:MAG: hypothetical protein WDO68_04650 [Gammaproteobacteria bacterium]
MNSDDYRSPALRRRRILVAVLAGLILLPAQAFAETRGYVFSMIHTAAYGGDKSNCPGGGNGGPAEIKVRIVMRQGYTREQADEIVARSGGSGYNLKDKSGQKIEYVERGRYKGQPANIANFPNSIPDPHIETVSGRYAYGFNLDGLIQPGSFEDPETHERGIDNQMWRVLGCFEMYDVRLPVRPYSEEFAWDTAMDSMPAWLLSVTGGDLSKDGDVTITFDRSLNILLRDTRGGVMHGSTFVVDPDPRSHSVFKGRIKDQVLTITEPGDFSMQGESQFFPILRFSRTHVRLRMNPDGTLSGLIGGYQPWPDYYYYLAVRSEEQAHIDLQGVFYAFRRLADGELDSATGERTLSAAYWMEAVPAFHAPKSDE